MIEVGAEAAAVDEWKAAPPREQRFRGESTSGKRPQLGDRAAVKRHREGFTTDDALEDAAPMISKIADGDVGHMRMYHR
ncbi:hypothetical protein BH09GEM1_BH09GEM1_22580 [soil metagenome]